MQLQSVKDTTYSYGSIKDFGVELETLQNFKLVSFLSSCFQQQFQKIII